MVYMRFMSLCVCSFIKHVDLQSLTREDPHASLHAYLYYANEFAGHIEDDDDEDDEGQQEQQEQDEQMLQPGWRQAVEEKTQQVLWDLCYNPHRWRSWMWLCNEYKQALEVGGRM